MSKSNNILKKNLHLIIAAILGSAAFIFIYGIEPLRVTGIGWTEFGYGGRDITQHQTGWMFYRNSPWSFPLCKALYLGYPLGTSISNTDSIPLVALFFKMISQFLPKYFQYFGLYTLFSFMMQGLFSAALLYRFTHDRFYSAIGSIVFVMSSSFLERSFRHTALSSYWLLLAALLLFFCQDNIKLPRLYRLWTLLLCVSLGIHPYLFIMVLGVFIFSGLKSLSSGKKTGHILCGTGAGTFISVAFGFILGIFGFKTSPAEGFGIFSLNLNGLFNPRSKYHSTWSSFLQNRPVYYRQGDGIYYLGFGLLISLVILFILILIKKPFPLRSMFHKHIHLVILSVLYTVFAISNVVTFDDHILLTIKLPEWLFTLCSIFRASERFFLIPYYCIILTILTIYYRLLRKPRGLSIVFLIILVTVQILDIIPGLKNFHHYFSEREELHEYSSDWQSLAGRYHTALTFEQLTDRILAMWLARNDFRTNMNISAQIHLNAFWEETQNERDQLKKELGDGTLILDPDTIYIIPEFIEYNWSFDSDEDLQVYLEQVRSAYEGEAELKYLSMDLNDAVSNYWILCPY